MVILLATSLDDRGHYRYALEAEPREPWITDDISAVVSALRTHGAENPYILVSHAEHCGMVELIPSQQSQSII